MTDMSVSNEVASVERGQVSAFSDPTEPARAPTGPNAAVAPPDIE